MLEPRGIHDAAEKNSSDADKEKSFPRIAWIPASSPVRQGRDGSGHCRRPRRARSARPAQPTSAASRAPLQGAASSKARYHSAKVHVGRVFRALQPEAPAGEEQKKLSRRVAKRPAAPARLSAGSKRKGQRGRYDFSEIDTLPFSPAPICREASNSNRSRKHYELPIS